MSVKPVAWLYTRETRSESEYMLQEDRDLYAIDSGWTETPLYSAPAPELAEKLRRLTTLILERDWDCPKEVVIEAHESVSLLARITPK